MSNGNKKICPIGWHVPTDAEWTTLTTFLGGDLVAGGKMKEVGPVHWSTPNIGATNETGFTSLPGGYRSSTSGMFFSLNFNGYWWSSNEMDSTDAWFLENKVGTITAQIFSYDKGGGMSVRCLKD